MANRQHLKILKEGVRAWNQWRAENPRIQPDLENASLVGVDLCGANLVEAKLGEASLTSWS